MPSLSSRNNFQNIEKLLIATTFVLIGWYVLLCVTQLLTNRPLWNDEAAVFASVKAFSVQEIFGRKLLKFQVFPRVYLYCIQQFSKNFDFSLLALRLPSFICMMTGFFVWQKIIHYEFKKPVEIFLFTLSWCASSMLIYYSSELKPYSMDVCTASIILLFIYHQRKMEEQKSVGVFLLMLMLLPLFGFFSYPSFILLLIPLYNLILMSKADLSKIKYPIIYGLIFIAVGITSYFIDMRYRHVDIVTKGFGDYFISFESIGEFFKTLGEGTQNLFTRWFAERPRVFKKIPIPFMLIGLFTIIGSFINNYRKDKYFLESVKTVAFVIFLGLLSLGILQKYPYTVPRTSLFFCPFILFMTVKGIRNIVSYNRSLGIVIQTAYMVFLVVMVVLLSRVVFSGELTILPKIL